VAQVADIAVTENAHVHSAAVALNEKIQRLRALEGRIKALDRNTAQLEALVDSLP